MTQKNNAPPKPTTFPVTSLVLPGEVLGELLYDERLRQTSLVTFANGTANKHQSLKHQQIRYEPYSPHNPLLLHRVVRFASDLAGYRKYQALLDEVRQFINRFVELPPTELSITTHYVFLTWVYDSFNEVPYLRVRGDFGSGKTRFLNVVSALCYKPIMASGASSVAPLFHILDQIGGTLVLDEADYRFSGETADITKILNNGTSRGFPVLRCEKKVTKEFRPRAYQVFGPKLIATRFLYKDEALESRCISLNLNFKRKRKDIPLTLPKDFEDQAITLRNKLLMWRFKNFFKPRSFHFDQSIRLNPRSRQMYASLLSLVQSKDEQNAIVAFAQQAQAQAIRDRGLKSEADVLWAICELKNKNQPLVIGDIANTLYARFGKQYERKITPSWVGGVVRSRLNLMTMKTNGVYVIAPGQESLLMNLLEKFDVMPAGDESLPKVPDVSIKK